MSLAGEIIILTLYILILIIFFFPSVSFWLSGIRAEGLVFLFMAISIHYSAKWFNNHKISSLILTMIGILGMLAFRGVYLLVFIPAFISWILTFIYKRKPVFVFFLVYILSASLFFGSSLLSERNNLPSSIVSRQQDFFHLPGKTIFRLDTLNLPLKVL